VSDVKNYKKGTTTIGIHCVDGIVFAADKRASLGHLAMHKQVDKIFKLTNKIAITTAGMVSDAQILYKYLKAELELYKLNKNAEPTADVAAALLSNLLYGGRQSFFPYMVGLMVGGANTNNSFKIYSLETSGSSISDKYIAIGSGMELAYGSLENNYRDGLTVDEGVVIALKALHSALQRDVFSGDGIDVVIINAEGYKKFDKSKIEQIMKKK